VTVEIRVSKSVNNLMICDEFYHGRSNVSGDSMVMPRRYHGNLSFHFKNDLVFQSYFE